MFGLRGPNFFATPVYLDNIRPLYHGMVAAIAVLVGGICYLGNRLENLPDHKRMKPWVALTVGPVLGALFGFSTFNVHIPWFATAIFGSETQVSFKVSHIERDFERRCRHPLVLTSGDKLCGISEDLRATVRPSDTIIIKGRGTQMGIFRREEFVQASD